MSLVLKELTLTFIFQLISCRVHTEGKKQNSLTFPWHKFKFPWPKRSAIGKTYFRLSCYLLWDNSFDSCNLGIFYVLQRHFIHHLRTKGSWGDKGRQTLQFSFRQKNLEAVRIVQHDPNSKENCPSHFQYFSSFFFFIWKSKLHLKF